MTEINSEVTIENICRVAKTAQHENINKIAEATNKLLEEVLKSISNNASAGSSSRVSISMHDIHHKEIYPLANRVNVLKILKDRGFEASIGRAHPAFPDCDCGGEPCMDWLRVDNTWNPEI